MLKDFYKNKTVLMQFAKYIGIGGVCAVFELCLFTVFGLVGMGIYASNISAVVIATVANYMLNKFWAFESKKNSAKSLVLYVCLFMFNLFFSSQFIVILTGAGIHKVVAKLGSMVLITCWNFILYKKVIFK